MANPRRIMAVSIAVLLTVTSLYAAVRDAQHALDSEARFLVASNIPCTNILANTTVNATVSGVYAAITNSTGSGHATPLASLPSQSGVDNATISMFRTVCSYTQFQTLVQVWGVANFSLEYYTGHDNVALEAANFTVTWATANGSVFWGYEEWWSGNLSTATISGPYTMTNAATAVSAALPTMSFSKNWAGFNWTVPKPSGAPDVLTTESAYTQVATIKNPACCQHNVGTHTIDPVAAVWTGLEGAATSDTGGTYQLLQTGFVYDTVNPNKNFCAVGGARSCHYGLWWEDLTIASTLTVKRSVAFMYSGTSHARLGDVLQETVFANTSAPAGNYTTVVVDVTLNHTWSHTISIPNWTPTAAPFITEAANLSVNRTGFHIQQIANFNQTYFEYGVVCGKTMGCVRTPTSSYGIITLEQLASNHNTAEAALATCPNLLGPKTTNCQIVQWLNSNYDYLFV